MHLADTGTLTLAVITWRSYLPQGSRRFLPAVGDACAVRLRVLLEHSPYAEVSVHQTHRSSLRTRGILFEPSESRERCRQRLAVQSS